MKLAAGRIAGPVSLNNCNLLGPAMFVPSAKILLLSSEVSLAFGLFDGDLNSSCMVDCHKLFFNVPPFLLPALLEPWEQEISLFKSEIPKNNFREKKTEIYDLQSKIATCLCRSPKNSKNIPSFLLVHRATTAWVSRTVSQPWLWRSPPCAAPPRPPRPPDQVVTVKQRP